MCMYVLLLSFTIIFWHIYFYFQFASKEKETHPEIKCLIQGHPGGSGGALSQCVPSFHNPHVSPWRGGSQWQSHPPTLPGETGPPLQGWGMWEFSGDSSLDDRRRVGFKCPWPAISHTLSVLGHWLHVSLKFKVVSGSSPSPPASAFKSP